MIVFKRREAKGEEDEEEHVMKGGCWNPEAIPMSISGYFCSAFFTAAESHAFTLKTGPHRGARGCPGQGPGIWEGEAGSARDRAGRDRDGRERQRWYGEPERTVQVGNAWI